MLQSYDREPLSLATITSFIGNGVPKLVERCLSATGDARARGPAVDLFYDLYSANLATLTRPYPGVTEFLERAKSEGHKLAICTNKPEAAAEELCHQLNLLTYFEAVIGGDTLRVRKPDPAPLFEAIKRVGGERATSMFVGDSITDFRTAEGAGQPFAFFSGGYQPVPIKGCERHFNFDDWRKVTPDLMLG